MGRSDDMMIIRGVNVFPSQIEEVLLKVSGENITPNYQIIVGRENNTDTLDINVEMSEKMFSDDIRSVEKLEKEIVSKLRSMLGIGERTGNVPLEAMVFEYASLRGSLDGMDPTAITEIADYFEHEIGYHIPPMTPFVGRNFNVTRAGIHADGLLKDEEIYNIFNTEKLLDRPAAVAISKTSGLAGIAYWINQNYRLRSDHQLSKHDALVEKLKVWVDEQYAGGRTTALSNEELEEKIAELSGGVLKPRH